MQISPSWIEPRYLQWCLSLRSVHQNLVPINAHICDNAHVPISAEKLPGEIDSYRLWPADRDANIFDNRAPNSLLILNLKRRRLHFLLSLRSRDVIARPCVIGPPG